MRTALSVVLTLWPPAPRDLNVSMRRSLGSTWMSSCETARNESRGQTEENAGNGEMSVPHLHGLGQDDDRHGSRVDSLHPGGETNLGDPLHPVCPSFVLQMSVHVLPGDSDRRMVQTA